MSFIKKNKEFITLLLLIIFIGVLCELPSWLKGCYFVSGGDVKTQWYPFYVLNRRETINSIKTGSLPFYSWILFLGNNIWSSMTTYGFIDIYNLFFYPTHAQYFWIFDVQFILKLLVAGIGFYLLINYIFNNKKSALFAGVLYASSSFLFHFSSQSGFLSFVSFMPFYLLGIVKFIKENKKILFIINTTLLFVTNYYLFFSITVLSPFIFIYCYYNIKKSLNNVWLSMLKIMLCYVVGFMLSAVFTLPSFLYLLQNERLGDFDDHLFYYSNIKMYLHIINSFFVPNELFIYGNNVFNFSEHTIKELCIYSSSLVTLLVCQIFISKNQTFKISTILMYILFIVIMFVPCLGSLLNGFSEVCFRWTHLFISFNIFVSTYVLFVEKSISSKALIITAVFVSLVLLITFYFGLVNIHANISDYIIQLVLLLSVIIFLALYCIVLSKNIKLLVYVLSFEIVLYSILFGVKSTASAVSYDDIKGVTSVLADENSESVKDYLNTLDENNYQELYRTYVDYDGLYWTFSRNMNLIYGFEGVMSYDSTYEPSFSNMIDINEEGIIKNIYWEYSIEDPDLLDFVSCKYSLTLTEDKIPFRNYEIVDDNFRGGIIVSKNLDYMPIGTTYCERRESANSKFSSLKKYVISNDSSIDQYLVSNAEKSLQNVYYYKNQLEADVETDDISFVVLKLSYDDGYTIKVNDKNVPLYKCNGGMIGFPVEKGQNHISVFFMPKGFKLGFVLSIVGFVAFIFLFLYEKKIILNNK